MSPRSTPAAKKRRPAPAPEPRAAEAWSAPSRRAVPGTQLIRALVWASLVCGPIALAVHWQAVQAPVPAQTPGAPATGESAALGPTGWAERAVAAYVEGDLDAVRAFFPTTSESRLPAEPSPLPGLRTTPVGAQELAEGYWGVTVAVAAPRQDPQTPAVRYFTLGVVETGDGAGWAAVGLPGEVAAPPGGAAPEPDQAARPLPRGELTDTVERWARAYLAGEGELARYLAPESELVPVSPAPYTDLAVRSVSTSAAHQELLSGTPAEGTAVDVLAHVKATDAADRHWPLDYALTLARRSGRWEVSDLHTAPRRTNAPDPASSASPGPSPQPHTRH